MDSEKPWRAVLDYLRAVRRQWVALVTGSFPIAAYTILAALFRDTATVHHWWNNLPQWVVVVLAFLALTAAQFIAWKDSRQHLLEALGEIERLKTAERSPVEATTEYPKKLGPKTIFDLLRRLPGDQISLLISLDLGAKALSPDESGLQYLIENGIVEKVTPVDESTWLYRLNPEYGSIVSSFIQGRQIR